jgi:peptide/nickel transport system substrate-binding protein
MMSSAGVMGHSIRLLVNSNDSLRVKVAQEIGRMLNECGLIVTVEAEGTDGFRRRLSEGNFDLYLGQTKLSPNMDLSAFFASKGSLSFGGIANASMLTACWDALANSGNYYTLHQKVMEDGCLVPLLFRSYAVYSQRGMFDSLAPARDNIFFYTIGKTMESIR